MLTRGNTSSHPTSYRSTTARAVVLALGATLVPALLAAVPVAPAGAAVTIDPPVEPRAGTVTLTGTAGVEPGLTTSVLYVLDATRSTGEQGGLDCAGDGALGPEDDLNLDGAAGDVLDCEIAGVQALNRSLATTTGVQAGLVAFANQAAAADLDPVGSATFLPPGFTGGDPRPRLETVVASVQRNRIGLYDERDLGGSGAGTAFTNALSVALGTLADAPTGPKWIMFVSDGQSGIDDGVLAALASSGIRLRSFGVGTGATCEQTGSLYKMAAVTGESCTIVTSPGALAAGLTGSQPDAVSGVSVTIGDVAVAASVDAVGGWRASFGLGAGTYTATARATMVSGAVRTAVRTFTVAPGAGLAPGSVTQAPDSLLATTVRVTRPRPTRLPLPARVSGRVGRPVDGLSTAPELAGSRVLLQARAAIGDDWVTVDRGRADRRGRFDLRWKPRGTWRFLQVALEPPPGWGASFAAVPDPSISACRVERKRKGATWTVTCRTTARAGSPVRLLDGRTVLDRSRVKAGTFEVRGRGPVTGARIVVGRGGKVRLTL